MECWSDGVVEYAGQEWSNGIVEYWRDGTEEWIIAVME
jgi:hypothetical protein